MIAILVLVTLLNSTISSLNDEQMAFLILEEL
jgi:hypothetical protein